MKMTSTHVRWWALVSVATEVGATHSDLKGIPIHLRL